MKKLKRLASVFICTMILLGVIATANVALAANAISILVDGNELSMDVEPYIQNGRTMVPMRVIFEALDCEVEWNNDEKSITAVSDDAIIRLQIGNEIMYVNNVAVLLDVPAEITNERTFIPIRAISEALGCDVSWDNDSRTVVITSAREWSLNDAIEYLLPIAHAEHDMESAPYGVYYVVDDDSGELLDENDYAYLIGFYVKPVPPDGAVLAYIINKNTHEIMWSGGLQDYWDDMIEWLLSNE